VKRKCRIANRGAECGEDPGREMAARNQTLKTSDYLAEVLAWIGHQLYTIGSLFDSPLTNLQMMETFRNRHHHSMEYHPQPTEVYHLLAKRLLKWIPLPSRRGRRAGAANSSGSSSSALGVVEACETNISRTPMPPCPPHPHTHQNLCTLESPPKRTGIKAYRVAEGLRSGR
jgi:hypothetical protein